MIKNILYILLSFSTIAQAQSWTQIADFPGSQRDDGCNFTIGNKAYCFTGSNGSACELNGFVYDGINNSWDTMANLPAGTERQYATSFSYSNTGYMLCGITCPGVCLNDMYKYDAATNIWTTLPNFPGQARQGPCNFVLNDKAYIISGRTIGAGGTTFNDVWEYNITTSVWTQKNNLPFAGMFRGSAFQINGTGYVAFGLTNNNNFNHYIFQYDQLNDQWIQIPTINLPARNYVACAVTSNKAFFYGGQDSSYNITNDVRLFDPLTNTIAIYPGIPALGRKGGMAFSMNNIFYITTGVDSSPARVKETWKNDQFVGLREDPENEIDIKVFPNPASTEIHIETEEKLLKLVMRSALGPVILESQSKTISLENVPEGIYNLSLYFRSSIVNKKIVVKH
jgi:N-acetylneuraminic acid mutarotase